MYDKAESQLQGLDAISEDGYLEQVTGLPHRRVFYEELKRRVAEANRYKRTLTLLFIKIDKYADVVALGPEAEAMLLAVLAEILRGCLRDCDLGGRTGRSEFAVLLPDTGVEGAVVPANRFAKGVAESRRPVFRGVELIVGTSIGVASVVARRRRRFVREAHAASGRIRRQPRCRRGSLRPTNQKLTWRNANVAWGLRDQESATLGNSNRRVVETAIPFNFHQPLGLSPRFLRNQARKTGR